MIEYKSRKNAHITDKKAEIYGKRLSEIEAEGELTAELVVEDARNLESPLHDFFDWDDTFAAKQWRLHQARILIGSIEIVRIDKPQETTRAYHFVTEKYVSSEKVFSNNDLKEQVINNALIELEGWARRYEQYKELASLFILYLYSIWFGSCRYLIQILLLLLYTVLLYLFSLSLYSINTIRFCLDELTAQLKPLFPLEKYWECEQY